MSDHIPDPGQHRTLFYGHWANGIRGARGAAPDEAPVQANQDQDTPSRKRRCCPSWARLIAKVYQADPLPCRKCGAKLKVIAYITDAFLIRRILDHLGLRSPQQDKPPPAAREVHRVPVDEEGGELQAP